MCWSLQGAVIGVPALEQAFCLLYLCSLPRCSGLSGGPKEICHHSNSQNLWVLPDFGKGIFADVIKLRNLRWRDHPGLFRWALNPMTNVLIRETQGRFGRQKRRHCDQRGRAWRGVATRPQSRIADRQRQLEKVRNGFSPRVSRGSTAPTDPLILDFWPPDCERIHFCCIKPPVCTQFVVASTGS